MRNVFDVRRENLRRLVGQWGGPTSLSRKLGHSNGSYMAQLVGPNPSREISEKVAREIEGKLGLPVGWMDQEHGPSKPADEETLNACVRAVATCLQDAELRPKPAVYGTLVQLAYEHARLTGRIDECYVKRLMELLR